MAHSSPELQFHWISSSEKGLSSVTTLVVGVKSAILFDPPFLIPDANAVVTFIKDKTDLPLKAIFVTHHHPDHFFSANPILEAFPGSRMYASPWVRKGIDEEYDEKIVFWPSVFGKENVPELPQKPEVFPYTFTTIEGNSESPIFLLGPLQGDSVDHTLFWMPRERTLICGDTVYGRSTHVWVEEIETEAILQAWMKTLDVIEALKPMTLIPGHLEKGWTPDAKADLEHNRKYLNFFAEKVTYAPKKLPVDELFKIFKDAFPQADKNLDFFLGHLSNQFGEGGKVWEENRLHDVGSRTTAQLQGYSIR